MPNDRDVVIASACRTAIGNFNGTLSDLTPGKLGAIAIREAIARAQITADQVDEVLMGCILTAGMGQGVARQAAVEAGVPVESPAITVNMLCGSGMKAVMLAAQAIMLGDADIIVAGGVESMSQSPFVVQGARKGLKMGGTQLQDTMIVDALTDYFNGYHMGITAENLAEKYGISREEQDKFSCWSQNKAEAAIKGGCFVEEIVPVEIPQRKGPPLVFAQDEFPRFGCTAEALAKLKPAFKADGTVTAGNASGINDGAAALVIMSRRRAQDLNLTPMATIRAYGEGGVDPAIMGVGPVPASRLALKRAGLTVADLELVEANEAFAAQSLAVGREMQWPEDKLNVNGGAIALGHPVGASGARIMTTLLYEMRRRDVNLGLATLCIGGGMGTAVVLERN